MPTLPPALRRCIALVTLPTRLTTISSPPLKVGDDAMVRGASPIPARETSTN